MNYILHEFSKTFAAAKKELSVHLDQEPELFTVNDDSERQPAILSSGYSINAASQEILDQGCNGFIQKPFDLAQLSTTIRTVLGSDSSSCSKAGWTSAG